MYQDNVFVKVSGDLFLREDVLSWLKILSQRKSVVVCVGGGTQINNAFRLKGFPVAKHGPLGRQTNCSEERVLAKSILEKNRGKMIQEFKKRKINSLVIIPVLKIGKVLCHVNGDTMILTSYIGFDELFVLTLEDRVFDKILQFKGLHKIKVVGFPELTSQHHP